MTIVEDSCKFRTLKQAVAVTFDLLWRSDRGRAEERKDRKQFTVDNQACLLEILDTGESPHPLTDSIGRSEVGD